ncbi:P2Y purinoceptor 8 [Polypterus senegalus]|uniref:P2Y purinoceptor 8 n=1 Tax=Polypterus senegalus TaxID=55291 RepID=UPI001962D204|nr:P2Y purinoceptor 8 [Polypterus senegalus]XP_039600696.1 P2Y purinoceptor 8 [Polypterus senegalus]XP_039600697.1 P2Y purinoceptor 8 [Polypterus senegalus]XP_039600698.1 P2Y purinoceptor 8 [Polypterus senegalus]XP_039600699.1 P2Y purinoceptor 8 [Polypterus senegalus]XP_039600700.1 P2Y purinoceptor 8 [Polypterus senegalus]XP_039600701.1 P2Y purinoceptor 8 [Polypterus senegalus]
MISNVTQLDNATLEMFTNRTLSNTLSVIYILVILISFPGNILSMVLLVFHTKPKTPTIIFMINLSITDLALGSFLPFQVNYHIKGYDWNYGETLCSVVSVMFYANMYCSILTMMAISAERYFGIVHPMKYDCRRNHYAIGACLAMWALVLGVMYPIQSTDLTYRVKELNITTCFDVLKKDMLPTMQHWAAFLFVLVFILFLIPFIITVFCYIAIIVCLIKERETCSIHKRRAISLAILVVLVFVTCFAPNNIIFLLHIINKIYYNKSYYAAYKLSLSFSCVNSCLDPFIYYFASKDFRRKFRKLFGLPVSNSDLITMQHFRESLFSARSLSQGEADEEQNGLSPTLKKKESTI